MQRIGLDIPVISHDAAPARRLSVAINNTNWWRQNWWRSLTAGCSRRLDFGM